MRPVERTPRKEPDFGTYHYVTAASSEELRAAVRSLFADAFASLPFGRGDRLRVLDVGCGLGFLSCVSAEFYRNARVTGIDTFKHSSLKGSSLEKAEENARILKLSDRIVFKNDSAFTFAPTGGFDVIVSSLVFHNLGRRRFGAYSRIPSWTRPRAFVILGDFSGEQDVDRLSELFRIVRKIEPDGVRGYTLLVMTNG